MVDQNQSDFAGQEMFAKMWTEFMTNMAKQGMAFGTEGPSPGAAKAYRDAMLQMMSEWCEQYMRSPEFIEMMKESMSASIELRRQMNEFLGKAQHEFQGTSRQDVDLLMAGIQRLENRLTDAFERLDQRISALDERLNNVESAAPKKKAATKKRASKKS